MELVRLGTTELILAGRIVGKSKTLRRTLSRPISVVPTLVMLISVERISQRLISVKQILQRLISLAQKWMRLEGLLMNRRKISYSVEQILIHLLLQNSPDRISFNSLAYQKPHPRILLLRQNSVLGEEKSRAANNPVQ